MGTKISKLTSLISTKEKIDDGVLGFSKQFKLGALLKPCSAVKAHGFDLFSVLRYAK